MPPPVLQNTPLPVAAPDANALRQAALSAAGDPTKLAGFNDQGFANRVAGLYRDLGTTYADLDAQDLNARLADYNVTTQDTIDKAKALERLGNSLAERGGIHSGANIVGQGDIRSAYDTRDAQSQQGLQTALQNSVRRRTAASGDYTGNLGLLQSSLTGGAGDYLRTLAQQDAQAAETKRLAAQQQSDLAALLASMGGGGGSGGARVPTVHPDVSGIPINFTGDAIWNNSPGAGLTPAPPYNNPYLIGATPVVSPRGPAPPTPNYVGGGRAKTAM